MSGAERRGLPYLFKLRLTANVKKLIKRTFSKTTGPMRARVGKEGRTRCGLRAGAVSARWSSCAAG